MTFTLTAHQSGGIDKLRTSLATGHKRPILQGPTGFGKTVMMTEIIHGARAKGKRVMITVPLISLIDQTVEKLHKAGITDVGVIQGQHWLTDYSKPVQVASIQSLQRRKFVPKSDLVIVDEAHRRSDFLEKLMVDPEWQKTPFIGMTATPWTKGLGKHYDDIVVAASTQEMIDGGHLSPFRVFAPSHPDLKGVKTVAGDYAEGELSTVMQAPQLTADAVASWKKHGENRPTLCFAVDRAHGQALQEKFTKADVPCGYIDGETPLLERDKIRRALQSGKLKVVVNIACLTLGADWPFVSCISMCRPTKSEMLYVQIIGRGLRTCEGKVDCIVLDHSDTTERLGFVTDIIHDELDDGTPRAADKRKRQAEIRDRPNECGMCGALRIPKIKKCPACGFECKTPSKVRHGKGSLSEVTKEKKPAKPTATEKQLWWSAFLHYAQARGKSNKWVLAQYKQKFGVWPRHMLDILSEPTAEIYSWIKSRNIAWAKSRYNGAGVSVAGGAVQ